MDAMEVAETAEDRKPQKTVHHFDGPTALTTTEAKAEPLPWVSEMPTKTGEIFRNNDGQYSFMCFNCGLIFEEFHDIISHCESHFQDKKFDSDFLPSELIFPADAGTELQHSLNTLLPETVLVESEMTPNATVAVPANPAREIRRRRRRTKVTDEVVEYPQNCPICHVWCDDFGAHLRKVHTFGKRIFQCFMCKVYIRSAKQMKSHLSSTKHTQTSCYHCAMEPAIKHPSEPRRHKCLFCKEWFPNHVEFKTHFKDAHDKDADSFFRKRSNCNVFTCFLCEREFPLRYYLVAHMKSHYDKFLSHQCPTCGKFVRTFGLLTQHMKTHDGKIYYCDKCDKQFKNNVKLRAHLARHSTELKYQCSECPKAFKLRYYLNRHRAVHTNEKKHNCKYCSATFNFGSGRRAHEKSQHNAL